MDAAKMPDTTMPHMKLGSSACDTTMKMFSAAACVANCVGIMARPTRPMHTPHASEITHHVVAMMRDFLIIDMPSATELIAHGREVDEIRQIIGADGLIFQDLNDLIDAVRAENPDIQQFECSVFNGVYVTKDVDQGYLDFLDTLRNDDAKAVQRQNEVENLEMHNEG